MKINFAEIKFRPSLSQPEVSISDFHQQLAQQIWQSRDIAAGKFALALYDNPEVEVGEKEKGYIIEGLNGLVQWARIPVLKILGVETE